MKHTFSKIMSIDEMKISVLVIMFLFAMGIGTYSVIFYGDIPANLTNIIISIILSISGLNAMAYLGKTNISIPQNPSTSSLVNDANTERPI